MPKRELARVLLARALAVVRVDELAPGVGQNDLAVDAKQSRQRRVDQQEVAVRTGDDEDVDRCLEEPFEIDPQWTGVVDLSSEGRPALRTVLGGRVRGSGAVGTPEALRFR
jgi:hypothetical protein